MRYERVRDLTINPEVETSLHSALANILEELQKEIVWCHPPRFTPLAVLVFGSTLSKDRFDRDSTKGDRSDFDFLVIVAESFFADDVYRIGAHRSSSNAVDFVHLRRSADLGNGWTCDRDLDVILMSVENITWELSRIESLSDSQVVDLIIEDGYLTALASGYSLFNDLNDSLIPGLLRLQRIYYELETKPGH